MASVDTLPKIVHRPSTRLAPFSFRDARRIISSEFAHRPVLYWLDLIATLVVGYGAASIYLQAPIFSALQIACYFVAGFALFRAGSFIHEITHMRQGEMLGFRTAWNLLCGVPMLMPSFFYENHIDHHSSRHYGTIRDGEYLPLGAGPIYKLLLFWLQVPLLPLWVFVRFLIITPISFLHPQLRLWVLEHMSSFVINFRHRLTIPVTAPRKWWAVMEVLCCLRAWALVAALGFGFYGVSLLGGEPVHWSRAVLLYCLAFMTLGLNYVRNMAAHHYRNLGAEMSHLEQLEDSVNITGNPLTELFFPLGLRYHALHHLFPSLPFHNLGRAHRKLMAELPPDSLYHQTVYPSYFSVMKQLWNDAKASQAELTGQPDERRMSAAA